MGEMSDLERAKAAALADMVALGEMSDLVDFDLFDEIAEFEANVQIELFEAYAEIVRRRPLAAQLSDNDAFVWLERFE